MARGCREKVERSVVALDHADREWLISLFASFEQKCGDLDTLLAWRTEHEMSRRQTGFQSGCLPDGDRRLSPGRRLDGLSRAADRLSVS
jgi:hypothetical protein